MQQRSLQPHESALNEPRPANSSPRSTLRGPIVCAYRDEEAGAALAMAAVLARSHGVQVAAVGVARPLPFAATLLLHASRNAMERERKERVLGIAIERLQEELAAVPDAWGAYAVVGRFTPAVFRYARAFGSDLIVVPAVAAESGRTEHRAARRLVPGAWQAVLSVPQDWDVRLPERALVGVDFAPDDELLVRAAVAVMSGKQASLVLVHVSPSESSEWSGEWQAEYTAAATRHMNDFVDSLELPRHVRVETMVVHHESVAARLRELAEELVCDLLVIGSAEPAASGERSPMRLLGETAEALLHYCDRPLLVVPASTSPVDPERSAALELPAERPQLSRILVPLDGSLVSEEAIPYAASIARRAEATLRLVHVEAETSHELLPVTYPADLLREPVLDGVKVQAEVLQGPVKEALLEDARNFGADLLVLTSRGHGGVKRAVLGSVADRVIRHSEVPVLLVRPKGVEGAAAGTSSSADMGGDMRAQPGEAAKSGSGTGAEDVVFRRVLIPLDGSETAERMIPHALAVAGTEGVHYELVRVHPIPVNPALPASVPVLGRQLPENDGYLESAAARLAESGALVSVHAERSVAAAEAIVRRAEATGADLIAMTTRGLGGVDRMLFGSVADHVLRNAPGAVLVLRPSEVDHPGIHAGAHVLPAPRGE